MTRFRTVSAALLALPILLAASDAPPIDGTFALQTGSATTNGYLKATAIDDNELREHLDLWMTRKGDTTPIARYDVDMTKRLHLVVIADDFTFFDHVHPVLGKDGHFTIDESFPATGSYRVYADATPTGVGQQVFRFALPPSRTAYEPATLPPSGRVARAGPYTVELSATHIEAGKAADIVAHVRLAGKPATDLHPYLGALAHVVIISSQDLSYVHVHPMPLSNAATSAMKGMTMTDGSMAEMPTLPDSATSSPDMLLHVELRKAGTYKVWFQFRGGSQLDVAPFVIDAS